MFIKRKKLLSWSLVMVIPLLLWGGGIGYAKVTGRCDNCHTMHYSQGGTALTSFGAGSDGPYNNCLINDCVGCHSDTGTNATKSLGTSIVPVVNSGAAPPSGAHLAGGNFYWVAKGDDAKGHNVYGIRIPAQDATITKAEGAPGDNNKNSTCGDHSCHSNSGKADHHRLCCVRWLSGVPS